MFTVKSEVDRDQQQSGANSQETSNCPNCHALMPREMRFCRLCGCRLGEGIEEYTETVRLQNEPQTASGRKTQTASARARASKGFKDLGTMAASMNHETVKSVTTGLSRWKVGRACKRVPRWMIWVFIPLFTIGMLNGLFSSSRMRNRVRTGTSASSNSGGGAYLGGQYKTAEGNAGALLKSVTPPGAAADKAGLVGGDVIISFDGKPVKSQDQLNDLLSETPVGKTVDVVYMRDGETKTAKLTTISERDNERIAEAFKDRPEGLGRMGIDDDDAEVVKVPGTNISGVRLDDIEPNYPADMAGVKEGDVVIQFDNTPIRTIEELVMRIHRAVPYSTIKLVVMRGTERLEIPVKMGRQQ
jgi:membrane-associated protease RseP (regulator of RpoE activity)